MIPVTPDTPVGPVGPGGGVCPLPPPLESQIAVFVSQTPPKRKKVIFFRIFSRKNFAMSEIGCNFASLFGSRGPCPS